MSWDRYIEAEKGSQIEPGNSLRGRWLFSFEPGKLDDIETRAFEGRFNI
ncbi:hypothetical protein FHW02_000903 [Ochrobactrum sp. RH1CCR137]|nr:hypothetical protein [Ochrobactrum sp. RH1CCR137]MBA8854780.1 hypothetical protein [Ochrobactrum sp. RH1CCR134]